MAESFIEKYPEFTDKVFHTEEIPKDRDDEHIQKVDVEQILDKHFMRKLLYKDAILGCAKDMADYRQKVKDAIMKHLSLDKALFNKIKPENITNLIEELDLE